MSGHSKWSSIKHKKAITDKKRGQTFSKISRIITIAARKGTDPKANSSLAQAIERARAMNMPKDNIDRAIKKVSDKASAQLSEIYVDVIGPEGIALRIKAITDSKNRTIAEIKSILQDNKSKMVPPNSIDWMFSQPSPDISDPKVWSQIDKLLEQLENHDDVEDVSSNITRPDL